MAKIVGYLMLAVVVVMTYFSGLRAWSMMVLAEAGIQRTGAAMEIVTLVLCGVVIPTGIAALLLKK